jgi:hypothetical protein
MDVTNCVPDHVAKYAGKSPKLLGANCWNLAMVFKGILPALRYSTPDEMAFFMRSPLCRPLEPGEKRMAGDIGSIRAKEKALQYVPCKPGIGTQCDGDYSIGEYHAFIYISDNLVYEKDGYGEYPYNIIDTKTLHSDDFYPVPDKPECRENQSKISDECPRAMSYYRCSSMDSYVKAHPEIPSELLKIMNSYGNSDRCFQKWDLDMNGTGFPLDGTALNSVLQTSQALVKYLKDETQKAQGSKEKSESRDFILGALQLHLQAIAEEFGPIVMIPINDKRDLITPPEKKEQLQQLANTVSQSLQELKNSEH